AACRATGTNDLDFLAAVSFNFGSLQFLPWQPIAGVRSATSIRWQAVGSDGDRAVFTVSAAGAGSSTAAFSVAMPNGALTAIRTVLLNRTSSATYALDNLDGDGFRDLLSLEGGTLTLFKGSCTGAVPPVP